MQKRDVPCVRGEVAMIAMKIGSQWASYDYRVAQIDQNDGGVVPFKVGEVVMVPLRAVVEGYNGTYEANEICAKAEMRDVMLDVAVGKKVVTVTENGVARELELPIAVTLKRKNIFLPLEIIGDIFGLFTAYYPNENHAKDVLVFSKRDLAEIRSPLNLPPVECLLTKIKKLREFVSMEVPKALFDLANLTPVIDLPEMDRLTMQDPEYIGKYAELYPTPEVAYQKEGVPKGTVTKYHMDDCKTYPEVQHDYWVYIPAQYDGTTPAKLLIMTMGEYFLSNDMFGDVPTMLDNLIHEGRLSVTIALFVAVGDIGSGNPAYGVTGGWANNFSPELDSTDERYSNFIVNELMPVALKDLNISENKYDRAIWGASSGAAGALGVAWHNNDKIGTVLAILGSFANIRGAFVWPYALRREKKDIRVFYLTSKRDANLVFGNWYHIAQTMASALEYGGYEYVFAIGKSGHIAKWPCSLLPEILEWAFEGKPFHHENIEISSGKIDESI